MGQTIHIDYTTPDSTTVSGFSEEKADILTIILKKPLQIDLVEDKTEKLRADVDYLYMESGVPV